MKLRDWIGLDMLDWTMLLRNPNAIHLLEQNQDKINWYSLSTNPAIFAYDYEEIKQLYSEKNSCVAAWFNQPRFIEKFIQEHGMDAIDEYKAPYKL